MKCEFFMLGVTSRSMIHLNHALHVVFLGADANMEALFQ
jgi:hypothetical protein